MLIRPYYRDIPRLTNKVIPHPLVKGIYSIKVIIIPLPGTGPPVLLGATITAQNTAQRTMGAYIYIIALGRHTQHTAPHSGTHAPYYCSSPYPGGVAKLRGFGGLCIIAIK